MRCIITADLHLGFVGAGRIIGGRNGREIDVEQAWARVVERTIEEQPDLILIGGDCLHNLRVSTHAVKALQDGIRRMNEETEAHIVVILGNHESPRTTAALSPVALCGGEYHIHIVSEPKVLKLRLANGQYAAVTCHPFNVLMPTAHHQVEPQPDVDVNVLLLHAAVRTSADPKALPSFYGTTGIDIGREADRWDVVALGDFHEYRQLVPGRPVVYPGSIERTSTNIWGEKQPKGIVLVDTSTDEFKFLEIPTRPMYDLTAASGEPINQSLRLLVEDPITADAIVRFNVECDKADRDRIDWKTVADLKARCFHFLFNIEWTTGDVIDLGDRRERGARALADEAALFFADDPARVRVCAMQYLGFAEKAAA